MDNSRYPEAEVVSVATNLNTRLLVKPSRMETMGDVRATIEAYHVSLFPEWGNVDVTSLEVDIWNGRNKMHDNLRTDFLFMSATPVLYAELRPERLNIPLDMLKPSNAAELNNVPNLELQPSAEKLMPSSSEMCTQVEEHVQLNLGQNQEFLGAEDSLCGLDLGLPMNNLFGSAGPTNIGCLDDSSKGILQALVPDHLSHGLSKRSKNPALIDRDDKKKKRKVGEGIPIQSQVVSKDAVDVSMKQSLKYRGLPTLEKMPEEHGIWIAKSKKKDLNPLVSQTVGLTTDPNGCVGSGSWCQLGHQIAENVFDESNMLGSNSLHVRPSVGKLAHRAGCSDDCRSGSLAVQAVAEVGKTIHILDSKASSDRLCATCSKFMESRSESIKSLNSSGSRRVSAHATPKEVAKEADMLVTVGVETMSPSLVQTMYTTRNTDSFGSKGQTVSPVGNEMFNGSVTLTSADLQRRNSPTRPGDKVGAMRRNTGGEEASNIALNALQEINFPSSIDQDPKFPSKFGSSDETGTDSKRYKNLCDIQDGIDKSLSPKKLRFQQEPQQVDEVHDSEGTMPLAYDSLPVDPVRANEVDVGHPDMLHQLSSEELLEVSSKKESCSRIEKLDDYKGIVQKEPRSVECLKIGENVSENLIDLQKSIKPGKIDGFISANQDDQQLQAAIQLARMSMGGNGGWKRLEKSRSRKAKMKKQESSILQNPTALNDLEPLADVSLDEQRLPEKQRKVTENPTNSYIQGLSGSSQDVDTNCLSGPNLGTKTSPQQENSLDHTLMLVAGEVVRKQDGSVRDENRICEEVAVDAFLGRKTRMKKGRGKQSPAGNGMDYTLLSPQVQMAEMPVQAHENGVRTCTSYCKLTTEENSGKRASFEYRDLRKCCSGIDSMISTKSAERKFSLKGEDVEASFRTVGITGVVEDSQACGRYVSEQVLSIDAENSSPTLDEENLPVTGRHTIDIGKKNRPDSQVPNTEFGKKNVPDSQLHHIQVSQSIVPDSQDGYVQLSLEDLPDTQTLNNKVGKKKVEDKARVKFSDIRSKLICGKDSSKKVTDSVNKGPPAGSGVSRKKSREILFGVGQSSTAEPKEPLLSKQNEAILYQKKDAKKKVQKPKMVIFKSAENSGRAKQTCEEQTNEVHAAQQKLVDGCNYQEQDGFLCNRTPLQGQNVGEEAGKVFVSPSVEKPDKDQDVLLESPIAVLGKKMKAKERSKQVSGVRKRKLDLQSGEMRIEKPKQIKTRGSKAIMYSGDFPSEYERNSPAFTKDGRLSEDGPSVGEDKLQPKSERGKEMELPSLTEKSKLKKKRPELKQKRIQLDDLKKVEVLEKPGGGTRATEKLGTKRNANGRFMPREVNPLLATECPHGCGRVYSTKTSAYFRHSKTCAMRMPN